MYAANLSLTWGACESKVIDSFLLPKVCEANPSRTEASFSRPLHSVDSHSLVTAPGILGEGTQDNLLAMQVHTFPNLIAAC